MLIGVWAVYLPIASNPGDNTLVGLDYLELHLHRIRYAQEALFGPHPHLPAWYTRELLGTPFRANIQNFPFIPTRLLLIAWDPLTLYAMAVNLAGGLAALFTFLYARRIGLSRLPAALSGWTFACAGFFASRVMAGHLPLLEAYPALPLLLWLIEYWRGVSLESARKSSLGLLFIGLSCACLALAGHPQIPVYAMGGASIYALCRLGWRGAVRPLAAMATGVGSTAFALWPLWLLIRQSTRVLALDTPTNDIAFPYSRFVAFLFPWSQGWPGAVQRLPQVAVSFANDAVFWEAVCYIGWLPLLAILFLLVRAIRKRQLPAGPGLLLTIAAILGVLLSLPIARAPFAHLQGTFLRSPARMLYFTAFGLSLALGAAADALLKPPGGARRRGWAIALVAIAIIAHLLDLGIHDRQFVRMVKFDPNLGPRDEQLAQRVGDGRVAIDSGLWIPLNRRIDDVGYFDSIALAKPYAALLDMADKSPTLNTQYLDGSELNRRALSTCGVRFVMTDRYSTTPPDSSGTRRISVFPIPDAAPRAAIYAVKAAVFLDPAEIHRRLRDPKFDLRQTIMLPRNAVRPPAPPPKTSPVAAELSYIRGSEDEITFDVKASEPVFLRWLESWNPGWQATVDGVRAPVELADDTFVAVPVPAGAHTIRLTFATPGAAAGGIISFVSLALLATVAFMPRRARA